MAPKRGTKDTSSKVAPKKSTSSNTKAPSPKKASGPKAPAGRRSSSSADASPAPRAAAASAEDTILSIEYLTSADILRSPTQLTKRLEKVHELLRAADQDADVVKFEATAAALGGIQLLSQQDKHVRALTACCLSDVIRIFAPDAPYDDHQLKRIFGLFIDELGHLADRDSPLFDKYFYLLEHLAMVKAFILILDVYDEDLLVQMFDMFFDTITESHTTAIRSHMVEVMCDVIEQSEDQLSPAVLEAILVNLVAPIKHDNKDAYRLAQHVVHRCSNALEKHVSQLVVDLKAPAEPVHVSGGSGSSSARAEAAEQSELREHIYELIFELNRIEPSLLSRGVFQALQSELIADDTETRRRAVAVMARMYAVPDSQLASGSGSTQFGLLLGRFSDNDSQIRSTMTDFGQVFLLNHAPPRTSSAPDSAQSAVARNARDVCQQLAKRTEDSEERIRQRAVEALCNVAVRQPLSVDATSFLAVQRALKDKKAVVRHAAIKGCVRVWRRLGCDSVEWRPEDREKFSWLPSSVLLQYAVAVRLEDPREKLRDVLLVQREVTRAFAGHTPLLFPEGQEDGEEVPTKPQAADFRAAAGRTAQNLLAAIGSVDEVAANSWSAILRQMRAFQQTVADLVRLRHARSPRASTTLSEEESSAIRAVAAQLPSADTVQQQLAKLLTANDKAPWAHISVLACLTSDDQDGLPSTEEIASATTALHKLAAKYPMAKHLAEKLCPAVVAHDVCSSLLHGGSVEDAEDDEDILSDDIRKRGSKSQPKKKAVKPKAASKPVDTNALHVLDRISQVFPVALAAQASSAAGVASGDAPTSAEGAESVLDEILSFFEQGDGAVVDRALRLLQNESTAAAIGGGPTSAKFTKSLSRLKSYLYQLCSEGSAGKASSPDPSRLPQAKLSTCALYRVFSHRLTKRGTAQHEAVMSELFDLIVGQLDPSNDDTEQLQAALTVTAGIAEFAPTVFETVRQRFLDVCWNSLRAGSKDDRSVLLAAKVLMRHLFGVGVLIDRQQAKERGQTGQRSSESTDTFAYFQDCLEHLRLELFGASGIFVTLNNPNLVTMCTHQLTLLAVHAPALEQRFISARCFVQIVAACSELPSAASSSSVVALAASLELSPNDSNASIRLQLLQKLAKLCDTSPVQVPMRYLVLFAICSVGPNPLTVHEQATARRLLKDAITRKRETVRGQEETVHNNPQLQQRLWPEYVLPHAIWVLAHDPKFVADGKFTHTISRLEFLIDQLWFTNARDNNVHRLRALLDGLRAFASSEPRSRNQDPTKFLSSVTELTRRCYQVAELSQLLITRKAESGSWRSMSDLDAASAAKTMRLPASLFCAVDAYDDFSTSSDASTRLRDLVQNRAATTLPAGFVLPSPIKSSRRSSVGGGEGTPKTRTSSSSMATKTKSRKASSKKPASSPKRPTRASSRSRGKRVSYVENSDDESASDSAMELVSDEEEEEEEDIVAEAEEEPSEEPTRPASQSRARGGKRLAEVEPEEEPEAPARPASRSRARGGKRPASDLDEDSEPEPTIARRRAGTNKRARS